MKENDWLLNNLANPTFTISDFKSVGLDTDNTSFESEDTYKNSPKIQQMEQFQTDGVFDEDKFHKAYMAAAYGYNNFVDEKFTEDINKQIKGHRNNIFLDLEQREKGPEVTFTREPNPLREISGAIKLGKVYDNNLSSREIAQREKILLNPVEYENGADPIWGNSPNDSFFDDFFETRVLAQWDNDGEHKDLVTGKIVKHKKGDLKLNENGTIFYENLQGRDIYDKQVLSKLDTITTDGSKWNKYDFFDSDDKDKSYLGSLFKVAATLAPLATPIAPYYVGVGLALQTAKLGATLGKIFTGNDNKVLSSIEGFVKSVQPSVSDESMEEMWTVENMLNLVGDVYMQLYQQRWLFQYGPALFTGGTPMATEAAQKAKQLEFLEKYNKTSFDDLLKYIEKKGTFSEKMSRDLMEIKNIKAANDMSQFMKQYNNIGKHLSRAYMTGITTADAYGDAIREGATDTEAAFLTLGYTAAQYTLMSTALGERILPELRAEKQIWKDLQSKLVNTRKATIEAGNNTATKLSKYNWLNNLFRIGYEAGTVAKTLGPKVFATVGSNALGEGIEETTEELLYDFTKSIFNGVQYLRGEKQVSAWDNMLDRYSMSFIGGMLGGGLMELKSSIRNARDVPEMTSEAAMQELIKIVRNGEAGEFLKTLDKNILGSKELSTELVSDEKGNYIFKPAEKGKLNQDEAAKQQIRNMVKFIEDTLESEGAKVFDEKIIDTLTRKDLKFNALRNSATASMYLQEYNTLATNLAATINEYNRLNSVAGKMDTGATDQKVANNEDVQRQTQLSNLDTKIKTLREQLAAFNTGEISSDFIKQAMFEMSTAVRYKYQSPDKVSYIQAATGKKYKDLDENTIKRHTAEWENYRDGKLKDDLKIAHKIHEYITTIFSEYLNQHSLKYFKNVDENQIVLINSIESAVLNQYKTVNSQVGNVNEFLNSAGVLATGSEAFNIFGNMVSKYGTTQDKQILQQFMQNPSSVSLNIIDEIISRTAETSLDSIVKAYQQQGYINPEVKRALLKVTTALSRMYNSETNKDPKNPEKAAWLQNIQSILNSLDHSNIQELLGQFNLVLGTDINIDETLKFIDSSLSNSEGNPENFILPPNIDESINSALQVINLLEAQILSARVDLADVDNILGLNKTANEVDPNLSLVELESREADTMLYDLNLIKQRVLFAKNLIAINNGQKIAEQDMTAAKFQLSVYKRLKHFQLPDTWDTEEWDATIRSMTNTDALLSKIENKLTQAEREQIFADSKLLDEAIHNLYIKNKDKITKEFAAEFMKNFNLLDSTEDILNKETKSINDRNLFWYMITRFAVKPSDFYYSYRQIITNDLAPFYSQELATYTTFAHIINNQVFQEFANFYNEGVAAQILNLTDEQLDKLNRDEGAGLSKDYPYSSNFNASRSFIAFIEGMPGTGKSAGVYRNLISLIRLTNPDLLKNVWIAHATQQSAEKLAKELGLENYVAMDKETYMKKVSPNWSESFDEQGNLKVQDGSIEHDDKYIYQSTWDINKSVDASLILVDEFSKYSFIDIDLQNKLSKITGIPIVSAGDLMQSRISGEIKEKMQDSNGASGEVTETLTINPRNFVTSPKQGVLLRATNEPMVKSIMAFNTAMPKLLKTKMDVTPSISDLTLYYTQIDEGDYKGLYGVKIFEDEYNDDDEPIGLNYDKILQTIDLMIETQLNPNEKIGYVYNDEESELYKTLTTNPKYSDKIKLLKGTSAQGLEAKYYIVEDFAHIYNTVDNSGTTRTYYNWEKYYTDLYTALTRSKQGCIWVKTLPQYMTNFSSQVIETDTPAVVELSKDAIKEYSQKRKTYLEKEYAEGEFPKFIPRVQRPKPQQQAEPQKVEENLNEEENGGLIKEQNVFDVTQKASEEKTEQPPVEIIKTTPKGIEFNLLMPSTFARETGFVTTNKGLQKPSNYSKRLDNLNGLTKLIPKGQRSTEERYITNLMDTLETIRGICYKDKDINNIAQRIDNILGLNSKNPYAKFFIKSNATNAHDTDNKYYKEPNEELYSVYSSGSKAKNHHNRTLSLVFGNENGDQLEVTLLTFPNVITLLNHEQFSDIKSEYDTIAIKNGKEKVYNNLVELRDKLKNSTYTGAQQIIDMINLFEFIQNGVFYIDNPEWTIGNEAVTYGIRVINQSKGYNYATEGYESNKAEWYDVNEFSSDSVFNLSKDIYIAPTGVIETGNKTIKFAKPGMPFILVSETKEQLLGASLFDTFIKELDEFGNSPSVSLVYLVPPLASIEQYFDNIFNILKGTGNVKSIGNDFTAYRLLDMIMKDSRITWEEGQKGIIESYIDLLNNSDNKKEILEREVSKADLKFQHKVSKVKKYLQATLYNLMYDDNQKPKDNLKILKEIMQKNNFTGIFYNTTFNKVSNATVNGIIPINKDSGSYSIDGNPFKINGKLDKSGYYMDMGKIISEVSKKIVPNKTKSGSILISTDNEKYESGFSNNQVQKPKSEKDVFLENLIGNPSGVKYELDQTADASTSLEGIISILNKNDRLVFYIDGKHLVTPRIGNNLKIYDYKSIKTELIEDNADYKTFKILADNDEYTATIKMDGNTPKELSINKVNQQSETQELTDFSDIDAQFTDNEQIIQLTTALEDFEGIYDSESEYDIDNPQEFWNSLIKNYHEFVPDIMPEEEFIEKMNSYDKDSIIYQVLEKLKDSKPIKTDEDGCNTINIKL